MNLNRNAENTIKVCMAIYRYCTILLLLKSILLLIHVIEEMDSYCNIFPSRENNHISSGPNKEKSQTAGKVHLRWLQTDYMYSSYITKLDTMH